MARNWAEIFCETLMRKSAVGTLKFVLTAIILAGIAWKLDVKSILEVLPSLSPYAVAIGFALALVQIVLAAGRLSVVVGFFNRKLRLRDSFHVTIQSLFFAQTFVSFIGSDVLRIWKIRHCGAPLSEAVEAVTLDRLMGIIVNHLFLLAALPWLLGVVGTGAVRTTLLMLAAAGVAGMIVVLVLGFLQGRTGLSRKLGARFGGHRAVLLLTQVATVGRHLLEPRWSLLQAAALSLGIALMNSVIFFVILRGWQVEAGTAVACALLVPGILEIAMLPISIAGWGVREGVAIVAFGHLGVPAAIAFGTSVVFALISLVLGLVGGLLWLINAHEMKKFAMLEGQDEKTFLTGSAGK